MKKFTAMLIAFSTLKGGKMNKNSKKVKKEDIVFIKGGRYGGMYGRVLSVSDYNYDGGTEYALVRLITFAVPDNDERVGYFDLTIFNSNTTVYKPVGMLEVVDSAPITVKNLQRHMDFVRVVNKTRALLDKLGRKESEDDKTNTSISGTN